MWKLSAQKLAKFKESEVTLDEEQYTEMCSIVERTENDDLEKLLREGNEHGVGELIKEIWFTDRKRQTQQLANDQATNGEVHCCLLSIFDIFLGSRGNRWSFITIRMDK